MEVVVERNQGGGRGRGGAEQRGRAGVGTGRGGVDSGGKPGSGRAEGTPGPESVRADVPGDEGE